MSDDRSSSWGSARRPNHLPGPPRSRIPTGNWRPTGSGGRAKAAEGMDPEVRSRHGGFFSPVMRSMMKPGRIYHTVKGKPEGCMATGTNDGWWGHPVLIVDVNNHEDYALVLILSTLQGDEVNTKYKNVTAPMRKRVLRLADASERPNLGTSKDGRRKPEVYLFNKDYDNLPVKSFVKINKPVSVEYKYISNLKGGRLTRIDDESLQLVKKLVDAVPKDLHDGEAGIYQTIADQLIDFGSDLSGTEDGQRALSWSSKHSIETSASRDPMEGPEWKQSPPEGPDDDEFSISEVCAANPEALNRPIERLTRRKFVPHGPAQASWFPSARRPSLQPAGFTNPEPPDSVMRHDKIDSTI